MKRSIVYVLVLAGLAFGRRYYDPEVGMWISVDPMEQHFSPYTYGGNNPVNRIDPDGGADYGTGDKLELVGTDVVGDANFQQLADGTTFCNQGAMKIVNAEGTGFQIAGPISGQANAMYDALQNTEFASSITADKATWLAGKGISVIAAWKNEGGGSGHVAVVAVGTDSKGRPMVYNVGPAAYQGKVSIATAFSETKRTSSTFGFYALNEDLNSFRAINSPPVHLTK